MDPRGTVGSIYKGEDYTLFLTTYESSGPYGFGEEGFFYVFPMTPPGRGPYGPRGTIGRIYKEDHYTLLKQNMKALGLVVSEKKIFLKFFP